MRCADARTQNCPARSLAGIRSLRRFPSYDELRWSMFDFTRIFGRHEIDVWRDEQVVAAAAVLNEIAVELTNLLEGELTSASLKDALVSPSSFIAARVAPAVRAASEAVVAKIIDRANSELHKIVTYQAVWSESPRHVAARDGSASAIRDVVLAAAPLAGGAATLVALPSMSVTTTTALFGLFSSTIISWPVVAIGGTAGAAAIATGLLNGAKIHSRAVTRLRKIVHDYVVATLLRGQPGQPSVLEQLTLLFAKTAAEAKKL